MLHLIDASCVICRHGFASAKMVRESDGLPVNALNGVAGMLWRMVNQTPPLDHVAMVFDCGRASSYRREVYPDYKAQRPPLPDWLAPQFDLVRKACDVFGIARLEHPVHEADDVIATFAVFGNAAGHEVKIVSTDKDLMQLVSDEQRVSLLSPADWSTFNEAAVKAKYGVEPHQVVDWLALMGDASDNIPGVPGVGEKTAASLLAAHGTLDHVIVAAAEGLITKPKLRSTLMEHGWLAHKSRELTQLMLVDIEHPDPLADTKFHGFDRDRIHGFLLEMGLVTLAERVATGALEAA
jgi:DNA polymerase-1